MLLNWHMKKKLLVIVDKVNEDATLKCGNILFDSGKALEEIGLMSFANYRILNDLRGDTRRCRKDILCGQYYHYDVSNKEYPGFVIHGKEKTAKKKIVVLGSSTTDYGILENLVKCWPEYLLDKVEETVIYNGAVRTYSSVQECLKLLRDVSQLNPDLVISYSGINEAGNIKRDEYPFVWNVDLLSEGVCGGVKYTKTKSERWITMERYMQAISRVNGSEFISILEPSIVTKKELPAEEKRIRIVFDEEWEKNNMYPQFVKEIREQMPRFDWMYDLTNAFEGISETVYRDNCHLNDLGNQIIADKVYNIIDDYYACLKKGDLYDSK